MSHGYDEALHGRVMRRIARSFVDTPMVLKGGTALMLCYGLDRFSTDLDFNSEKRISLESRVLSSIKGLVEVAAFDTLKDTDTVTKCRLTYGDNWKLIFDVSHREVEPPDSICIVSGIKTYKPDVILGQKLRAMDTRTASRDIYDIGFLVRKFPSESAGRLPQLKSLMRDLGGLSQRYAEAFAEDEVLADRNLDEILLELDADIDRLPIASRPTGPKSLPPPPHDPPTGPPDGMGGL